MGHAHAKLLKLRLFLEGIETPVIACTVSGAPNSPLAASIQIPPLDAGTKLLPRTTVHVFFYDPLSQRSPVYSGRPDIKEEPGLADNQKRANPTAYERQVQERSQDDAGFLEQMRLEGYKVVFMGETAGFQWSKDSNQRSLVLQCVDFSNYLDYAYQADNTDIFGPGLKAVFSGSSTNLFTDFLTEPGSVLVGLVMSGTCQTFPKLKGLSAGVIRMIEGVMGSYYPPAANKGAKPPKKYAGQNIFFTFAELRLHILQQFGMYEDDPTTARLLQNGGWDGLFGRSLGNLGSQVSIRAAIQAISAVIFHELNPQPCPMYLPGGGGTVEGMERRRIDADERNRFIIHSAELAIAGIEECVDRFPELQDSSDEFLDREGATTQDIQNVQKSGKERQTDTLGWLNSIGQMLRDQALKITDPDLNIAKTIFQNSSKQISIATFNLKQWWPGAPASRLESIKATLEQVAAELDRVLTLSYTTTPYSKRDPARIFQQIYRPDIWFAPPPRCNVVFPESYTQFSYARSFFNEPTRLLLKTNDEFFGEDELFDKFFFAPKAGTVKKDQARLRDMFNNDLMDHELFTGILPIFEKMGEFNVYASKKGQRQKTDQIGLAQRTVNFLYFKHRFNARQARLSMRFNPYIALGFPGLIIDKYIDRTTLETLRRLREQAAKDQNLKGRDGSDLYPNVEIPNIIGTNFLGNFATVQHTMDAAGMRASTDVQVSYTRQPDEGIEFFGILDKEPAAAKEETLPESVTTTVAVLESPQVGTKGPKGGKITEVRDVTAEYEPSDEESTRDDDIRDPGVLPLFIPYPGQSQATARTVPIGREIVLTGRDLVKVPSAVGEVWTGTPRAFAITEEVPRYLRHTYGLPAEEYIRPGWYGDIWSPQNIGKAYRYLLGVGSICDPQDVVRSDRGPVDNLEGGDDAAEERDPQVREREFAAALKEGASIEQAVEYLVELYSYVKRENLNADEFVETYNWRPIASLIDMFGTTDLEYDETGNNVVQGMEGFHSRAFGPYEDAFGLVGAELEDVVGIRRGSQAAKKVDTRARKRLMVQRLVGELRFGRGQLG